MTERSKGFKKRRKVLEGGAKLIFLFSASLSVVCLLFITLFIGWEGIPLLQKVSLPDFLMGKEWAPTEDPPLFGILPFIAGSLWVTITSLVIAIPVGLSVGIYLAEISKGLFGRIIKSGVELLAGIPSVVFGLFGYIVIAPWVRRCFGSPTGLGILTASLVLAIMVLPTIINITEATLRAVPRELKEASFALGATHWQTLIKTCLPAGKSGIIAGIILGLGRSLGETMAVLMVAGNSITMPKGLLSLTRTLTMNIATDMKYAADDHWTSLFTTALVLFIFILGLNLLVQRLLKNNIGKLLRP